MDRESVENAIEIMPQSSYKTQWNGEKEVLLIPKDRWEYDIAYTITIHKGARRMSGQEMQEYMFSFETESEDTIPPRIISTIPRNNEKIIAGGDIIITFFHLLHLVYPPIYCLPLFLSPRLSCRL